LLARTSHKRNTTNGRYGPPASNRTESVCTGFDEAVKTDAADRTSDTE
jgi:hypothetical protein